MTPIDFGLPKIPYVFRGASRTPTHTATHHQHQHIRFNITLQHQGRYSYPPNHPSSLGSCGKLLPAARLTVRANNQQPATGRTWASRGQPASSKQQATSQQLAAPGPCGVRRLDILRSSRVFPGKHFWMFRETPIRHPTHCEASNQQTISSWPDPGPVGSTGNQQSASLQLAGPGFRWVRRWDILRSSRGAPGKLLGRSGNIPPTASLGSKRRCV